MPLKGEHGGDVPIRSHVLLSHVFLPGEAETENGASERHEQSSVVGRGDDL